MGPPVSCVFCDVTNINVIVCFVVTVEDNTPCAEGATRHNYSNGNFTCICPDITCPHAYIDAGPYCERGE